MSFYNAILCINNCHNSYCVDYTISFFDFLKIVGTFVAFSFAYYQYRKTQKWKRAEFVLQLMNTFFNDFNVKRALRMLDWESIDIELKENEIENKKSITFDDILFSSALRSHYDMDKSVDSFSDEEAVIRFIMDDFFDQLGRFNIYIENKLIKKKDIENYLVYWINILGDDANKSKSIEVRNCLWNYLKVYNNKDMISLLLKFGYSR